MGALTRLRHARPLALPAALAATIAASAGAQAPAPPPKLWTGLAELGANVYFGNQPQTLVTTHESAMRAGAGVETRADVRFTYGEGDDGEGRRVVTRRAWQASAGLDLLPHAATSPFLLATYETSYGQRLRSRTSAGVGAKETFYRTDAGAFDVSLALLGERSAELDSAGLVRVRGLTRWSGRVRARRRAGDRVAFAHETFYRPEVANAGRFTVESTTTASARISKHTSLALTLLDAYDSRARRRGARSNNDGSLTAGVRAEF